MNASLAPASRWAHVTVTNKANALVASGVGNASRMRHCLRRYNVMMQRVQRKQVQIGFVPDGAGAVVGVTYALWGDEPVWSAEHKAMSRGYTHTVYRMALNRSASA